MWNHNSVKSKHPDPIHFLYVYLQAGVFSVTDSRVGVCVNENSEAGAKQVDLMIIIIIISVGNKTCFHWAV